MYSEERYGKALAVVAQRQCTWRESVVKTMPEKIMLGFSKMLRKGRRDLRDEIGEELCQEFQHLRNFWLQERFDERKIELELDKYLFMKPVPEDKLVEYKKFESFMLDVREECPIEEIITKILDISYVKFRRLFTREEYEDKEESRNRTYVKPKARELIQKFSVESNALEAALQEEVRGQKKAVSKFVSGYFDGKLRSKSDRHLGPQSYFFFLGPPGVGKTLLAETVANT